MLVVDQLQLVLSKKTILEDISFHVSPGSLLVIIGPNGSGKSSLLRCLSGWNHPTRGTIMWEKQAIDSFSSKRRAAEIAFLPQRPNISESIPIVDMLAAARYRFAESSHVCRKYALEILQRNNITHLQHRDWHTLSGGEAQRIAWACMQAQDAKLWLLDEPANHLDPAVQGEMYQNIVAEWMQGRTLIVVTHNINLILGAVPTERYSKVDVLGIHNGKEMFTTSLSDSDFCHHVGQLYGLPVKRVSVFERDHLVFGKPQ